MRLLLILKMVWLMLCDNAGKLIERCSPLNIKLQIVDRLIEIQILMWAQVLCLISAKLPGLWLNVLVNLWLVEPWHIIFLAVHDTGVEVAALHRFFHLGVRFQLFGDVCGHQGVNYLLFSHGFGSARVEGAIGVNGCVEVILELVFFSEVSKLINHFLLFHRELLSH